MKKTWAFVVIVMLAVVSFRGALFGAEQASETMVGLLTYTPAPDLSICFCGSFALAVEGSIHVRYLLTDAIDLREYDGDRVLVTGKAFSGFCAGTLEHPCSFVDVEKVIVLSRMGVSTVDWGALKMIYR